MTKHTKRILFYSAVAVFLLLSYIVILYAQGYKYSFAQNKFLRTGAIALRVNTGAKVYLNDELQGGTSFFNNAYSIDGLLPKEYKLKVEKENYSTWSKVIKVEEGLVTDFPSIFLLPQDGEEKDKLIAKIEDIFQELNPSPSPSVSTKPSQTPKISPSPSPTPDRNKEKFYIDKKTQILYQYAEGSEEKIATDVKGFQLTKSTGKVLWRTNNELWVMWLNDTNYQPLHKKGDRDLITRFVSPINNAAWFEDEDHIVVEFERKDSKNRIYSSYKIVEIDKRGGVNIFDI